ncbi:hypothetical protein BGW80DRAFT_1253583 [Lactifluus volemus]|nr:hypothetical protein BGW80DRAFT_1253583 [Lactifluus volemus]
MSGANPSKVLLVIDTDHTSAQAGDAYRMKHVIADHFHGHCLEFAGWDCAPPWSMRMCLVPREFTGRYWNFGRVGGLCHTSSVRGALWNKQVKPGTAHNANWPSIGAFGIAFECVTTSSRACQIGSLVVFAPVKTRKKRGSALEYLSLNVEWWHPQLKQPPRSVLAVGCCSSGLIAQSLIEHKKSRGFFDHERNMEKIADRTEPLFSVPRLPVPAVEERSDDAAAKVF